MRVCWVLLFWRGGKTTMWSLRLVRKRLGTHSFSPWWEGKLSPCRPQKSPVERRSACGPCWNRWLLLKKSMTQGYLCWGNLSLRELLPIDDHHTSWGSSWRTISCGRGATQEDQKECFLLEERSSRSNTDWTGTDSDPHRLPLPSWEGRGGGKDVFKILFFFLLSYSDWIVI